MHRAGEKGPATTPGFRERDDAMAAVLAQPYDDAVRYLTHRLRDDAVRLVEFMRLNGDDRCAAPTEVAVDALNESLLRLRVPPHRGKDPQQ
jgi:hypothetical protein